jgi:hypothetical protein
VVVQATSATSLWTQLPSKYTEHEDLATTNEGEVNVTTGSMARRGRGFGEWKMFTCEACENVCASGEWGGVMRGLPITIPASSDGDQGAFAASTSICTRARAVRICPSSLSGLIRSEEDGLDGVSSEVGASSRGGDASCASA